MKKGLLSRLRLALLPAVLLVTFAITSSPAAVTPTTVYIVRHAERLDNSQDSPLSSAGLSRAKQLAHVLRDAEIRAIFVTNLTRTKQTAAPLAAARGLTPIAVDAATPQAVVSRILNNHAGSRVLVVAHSNTVDDIATGLGAPGVPELQESQFDRLFVVQRVAANTSLLRLRYGAPTP